MRYYFLLLGLIFWMTGSAQQADQRRFIEINGTSETEAAPDELYVTVTLLERMDGKEKIGIEKQEADLKKAVRDLGIDLSNLSLNNANADYRSIRKKNKDVLISKNYTLKISNTEQLSKFYDRLDQMNAYDAYISKYTSSKLQELQKDNRVKAIKIAKEKADYLLAALGQQTGPPIQISELENFVQDGSENGPGRRMMANSLSVMDRDSGGADSEPIGFKKIKIRSSYLVKFEIVSK